MSSSCALLFIWWPRFIARIFPLCREPLFLFCPSFFAFPCLFSAVALYFFSSSSPRAPCLDFCFFFSFPSAIERQKIGLLRFLLAVWFVYSTFYFGRWIFYFLFIFMPVFSWFRNDRCQSTFLIFSPIFASSLLLHLFCVVYSSFRAMSQRRSIFFFFVCVRFLLLLSHCFCCPTMFHTGRTSGCVHCSLVESPVRYERPSTECSTQPRKNRFPNREPPSAFSFSFFFISWILSLTFVVLFLLVAPLSYASLLFPLPTVRPSCPHSPICRFIPLFCFLPFICLRNLSSRHFYWSNI